MPFCLYLEQSLFETVVLSFPNRSISCMKQEFSRFQTEVSPFWNGTSPVIKRQLFLFETGPVLFWNWTPSCLKQGRSRIANASDPGKYQNFRYRYHSASTRRVYQKLKVQILIPTEAVPNSWPPLELESWQPSHNLDSSLQPANPLSNKDWPLAASRANKGSRF